MPPTKLLPTQAGCWIDGPYGHYSLARLIELANNLGYDRDGAMCQEYLYGDFTNPMCDDIFEAADEAEAWLNENVAPEGFSFGWYDGEFFLWEDSSWDGKLTVN